MSNKSNLIALRLPSELKDKIPAGNLSAFIKDAIQEKLERDTQYQICHTCKGKGKVRRAHLQTPVKNRFNRAIKGR